MPKPLAGKTIFLTGTQKIQTIAEQVEEYGGKVLAFPLITIQERISWDDEERICNSAKYDWLIFTSQNAVEHYMNKLRRANLSPSAISCKIAAVGIKTAKALQDEGFDIDFMPTIFSADRFVQEFPGNAVDVHCLFLRGSLAKSTIRDALLCDEWTVYETVETTEHVGALAESLLQEKEPVVIFASPSAVRIYAKYIVPDLHWRYVTVASIGHITTAVLKEYGARVDVQPSVYTMQAVIERLIGGVSS
ncbi:uroporphyrinogen-III synthase [Lysinibacillus sp. 54212]|uniref:uroporphyrinogen-III synthase n=1 Tax=Lysinibacillus sp. 54212 TaxID=3119829 RepID=UPI002FCB98AE